MSAHPPVNRASALRRSLVALAGLMLAGTSLVACAAPEASPGAPPLMLTEVAAHPGHNLVHVMRAGDTVRLEADPGHPFEPDAVAAYWGAFKLGYLPREASAKLRCPPLCRVGDELPMGRIVTADSGAIAVEIVMPPWTIARMGH